MGYRYLIAEVIIDMDLQTGEASFEKFGIEYKQITTSDNPIGLVTAYFQS